MSDTRYVIEERWVSNAKTPGETEFFVEQWVTVRLWLFKRTQSVSFGPFITKEAAEEYIKLLAKTRRPLGRWYYTAHGSEDLAW